MLAKFAKLIGIEPRLAEDALHSERAAKHVLSRRSFFGGAAAAMAGAAVFSIPSEVIAEPDPWKLFLREDGTIVQPKRRSTIATFDALLKERYQSWALEPGPSYLQFVPRELR